MGFFSSRRAEPEPLGGEGDGGGQSLTRVIRSKFYNKSRTKERQPLPDAAHREPAPSVYASSTHRQPQRPAVPSLQTDNVTMSLAQRLNELASANENGLLDDDQYRLLRQNLFERFTAQPDVHADTAQPRIPQAPSRISSSADSSGQPHGSTRAPSVRSSRSVSTAMSSLFRRATTTRSNSQESLAQSAVSAPPFDTTSVRSGRQSISLHTKQATQPAITVTSSNLSMRLLRQHSYASMQSETSSATQADAVSMISRRTGHRSMKSRGPPSSFNVRFHDNSPPDEHPHDQATLMAMSSAEIRQEIARVEAEGKRLLDAFSGLELSTMAKQQNRDDPRPGARGLERSPSTWTLVPSDAASGVVPSSSASAVGTPSRKHRLKLNGYRSNDSLRGSSSHLPLPQSRMSTAIPEDGDGPEGEVDDIRRKRDEVRARYERKVEYLHAMLRGAEIREKLAKKKK